MSRFAWFSGAVFSALLLAVGCGDTTAPEGDAQFQILLTDAPADYIKSADVCISRAYLVPGEESDDPEEEGAPLDLPLSSNPSCFDLLTLRDGLTAELTEPFAVESGTFNQLRLVVESAVVELIGEGAEQLQFKDGTSVKELFVPSGMQSGIKVHLAGGPITPVEGSLTVLTVDFDVNDNFVLQGNPETPAGIHGILFKPVLKEKQRSQEVAEG